MASTTDLQAGELIEAFEYLDELRESGRTNMYAAPGYLQQELAWDRNAALEATKLWMNTFDRKLAVEDRVSKALAA
jgi:hypothetical protein